MRRRPMSPVMLESVAARFKVLAEPARLQVLQALQRGPQHVSALMTLTGLNQANLSRHLQLLHAQGFVSRRRQGTFIHYAIADARVFALCDLMCEAVRRPVAPPERWTTA